MHFFSTSPALRRVGPVLDQMLEDRLSRKSLMRTVSAQTRLLETCGETWTAAGAQGRTWTCHLTSEFISLVAVRGQTHALTHSLWQMVY